MLRELEGFVDRYPFVGFVQGAGLFLRMELVKDKKTKEPLPRKVTERIFTECVRRGLLTMAYAASFRIQPALTIDEATAKNGIAILREVFDTFARERSWQT
jgi:4-aminobutyrate aminotransferase-like enzyme